MGEIFEGRKAESFDGGIEVGASGGGACGDELEGLDGLGGLSFQVTDHAATSNGSGNTTDKLTYVLEDVDWYHTEYSSFHSTSGNGSYDSQIDISKAMSKSSSPIPEANVSFQPFDNSIMSTCGPVTFNEVSSSRDMDIKSMSKFILPPLRLHQTFDTLSMDINMLGFNNGTYEMAAYPHHGSSIIVAAQSDSSHIHSAPKAKCPPTLSKETKTLSKNKAKSSSSNQGPRYHCPTADCTRSYKRQFELIRHSHIHTNVRVHECRFDGCQRKGEGKGFARKDHLKQHLKLVHMASI